MLPINTTHFDRVGEDMAGYVNTFAVSKQTFPVCANTSVILSELLLVKNALRYKVTQIYSISYRKYRDNKKYYTCHYVSIDFQVAA